MADTKSLQEWEKEFGFIIKGSPDLNKQMTQEEFLAIDHGLKHGVNHEDRIKFLKDNGYEVTRENMIKGSLSSIHPPEL